VISFLKKNIDLASFTTLSVGGPARYFTQASSENIVLGAIDFARREELPVFVLGGGSNLLVSDAGFPGLVLQVVIRRSSITKSTKSDGSVKVRAGAGLDWDPLVAKCVERNLAGIECLSGVPGWVGATPVQNVGAYGQEVGQVISWVRAYDRQSALVVELSRAECAFTYRSSVFNTSERDRFIVLEVEYELDPGGAPTVDYPDLERFFARKTGTPSLGEVREAVREIRASKAMLLVDGDPDCRSAGSFFKNPIVSEEQYSEIENTARRRDLLGTGESLPRFPAPGDGVKVPAAWLIERSGFGKGHSRGSVGLSSKHTLALINRGGATAAQFLGLAGEIVDRIEEVFGLRLRAELAFVGFPSEVRDRFGADGPAGC